MTILDRILAHKREEVAERRRRRGVAELKAEADRQSAPRGFAAALERKIAAGQPAVIAELKKASPSKGLIRAGYEPAAIAPQYQAAGAACLSVLTDAAFFQGADRHLQTARQATALPVLRKDFMVDGYQILESRALGADCVLLIAAALDAAQLEALHQQALALGLDALIEVHDAGELETALKLNPRLVGINNRNLKTFETRLETTLDLLGRMPDGVRVVTESGFHEPRQVRMMRQRGVHAFLVGEAFMRADDPGAALTMLFGDVNGKEDGE
ncbi:MAG: indole-3-glycerol phosphate synthase TrpC [Gammaproteobacteria bacterium]|nr:indole-3-glycerol phosphate synthase TrpC [Gammaproteobacteria bacterium]